MINGEKCSLVSRHAGKFCFSVYAKLLDSWGQSVGSAMIEIWLCSKQIFHSSLIEPWSEFELMIESSVAESPSSISIHTHWATGTGGDERKEERMSWDRLGLSQRAVSQSVGRSVGGKRNPAESFWRRMLSSPPGLTGMHCRCGCYRQNRAIWYEIMVGVCACKKSDT